MSALAAALEAMRQPCGNWTDFEGVVHIREAGAGRTFCGVEVGAATETRPVIGCPDCVSASLRDYAYAHACAEGGCKP